MKHMISLLLVFSMMLMLAACSTAETQTVAVTVQSSAPTTTEAKEEGQRAVVIEVPQEADPQTALEEIYSQISRNTGLMDADDAVVEDVMGLTLEDIEEYYIRYMETDFGASDVYIIKPVEGREDSVRKELKEWQESRIRAFMGYDIYNSTSIAENAVIFTRGEYLVMLMLEDNDAARTIVETYIPEMLDLDD